MASFRKVGDRFRLFTGERQSSGKLVGVEILLCHFGKNTVCHRRFHWKHYIRTKKLTWHLKNKRKSFPDGARAEFFRLERGWHIQERGGADGAEHQVVIPSEGFVTSLFELVPKHTFPSPLSSLRKSFSRPGNFLLLALWAIYVLFCLLHKYMSPFKTWRFNQLMTWLVGTQSNLMWTLDFCQFTFCIISF